MPSGSDIRVPPRALSAAKRGRAERPGAAGAPAGAEEVHGLPTHRVKKTIEIEESPTRGNRAGDSLLFTAQAEAGTYRGQAVSSVATSGCPSSARAGAPVGARTNTACPQAQNLTLDSVQRLTLSLRNAFLRHRVGGTELLGEEADAQLLNHPVHAAERIRHDGACR